MKKVYVTSNIEETYAAMIEQEKWTLQIALSYIFIKMQVFVYNIILKILRTLWFEKKSPTQDQVKSIIVYGVGVLGDNIIRLHAIQSLKRSFPNAKLTVIIKHQSWSKKPVEELFKCTDFITDMYFVEYNPVQRKGLNFDYNDQVLPKMACDLFVNLSNFDNRGWFGAVIREIVLAKKLRSKFVVGFNMTNVLNSSKINRVKHKIVSNFPRLAEEVLNELNIKIDYSLDPFIYNHESEMKIEDLLTTGKIDKPFAVIHPGAKLECKMWPAERFAEVAKYLEKHFAMKSIITGVPSESAITQKVAEYSNESAIDFAGKTSLSETIELLRKATIVVSNDTGVMHLASVINIPTLGIYSTRLSPTNWFSYGNKFQAIFSFSDSSLRYTDEEDISDLLQISTSNVCNVVDNMIQKFNLLERT